MSYTYKFNYISPEPYYADIKEELKSYFDAGVVDDVMFPRWTEYCVRKIGRSSYPLVQIVVEVRDFVAKLPEDFLYIREVYACHKLDSTEVPNANSTYIQRSYLTAQNLTYNMCRGCVPDCVTIVEKLTGTTVLTFKLSHLLKPGNINTLEKCSMECRNLGASNLDSFDIKDGHIMTNLREGTLYITYYVQAYDENYYNLVPDFAEYEQFLKSYIRMKCFEVIFNSTTDETYNQIRDKYLMYKQEYDEAFIIVKTELMKKTPYQMAKDIRDTYRRFREYEM